MRNALRRRLLKRRRASSEKITRRGRSLFLENLEHRRVLTTLIDLSPSSDGLNASENRYTSDHVAGVGGANENPQAASTAGGNEGAAGITYDEVNNQLSLDVVYGSDFGFDDLQGDFMMAHIHGPGLVQAPQVNTNGPVLVDLGGLHTAGSSARTGSFSGVVMLTDAQEELLFDNSLYLNIHSSMFGAGEIRAQFIPVSTNGDGHVAYSNGKLTITDVTGTADNSITLSVNGDDLTISEATGVLTASGTGVSGSGTNAISIPIASITDEINFEGGGGNDSLTLDLGNGNPIPSAGLTFAGGLQSGLAGDTLIVQGNIGSQVITYTSPSADGNNGSLLLDGSLVTFSGLEPLTAGGSTDTTLNLPVDAANDATLRNSPSAGRIELIDNGATFEDTVIPNPTNSLTVNLGDQGDELSVATLDVDYAASLVIRGGAGADDVDLTAVLLQNTPGRGLELSGIETASLNASVISGNNAVRGGGLLVTGGTLTIDGSTISNNVASGALSTDGGGGVYIDGAEVVVQNSSINSNLATGASGSGGGVFVLSGGLSMEGGSISENAANRAGGGIEVVSGSISLTNTSLDSNDVDSVAGTAAPGNGGGLHVSSNATVTITGGSVSNNVAAAEGGGLWNSAGGTLSVDGTTIDGNSAATGGGVFNDEADGSATQTFSLNFAPLNDSGVSGSGTVTVSQSSETTREVRVQINAVGLEDLSGIPGAIHVAHIHGQFAGNAGRPLLSQGDGPFFDGQGGLANGFPPTDSVLPSVSDDDGLTLEDGFLDFLEGRPKYGPVLLNLTSTQMRDALPNGSNPPDGVTPLGHFLALATSGDINAGALFPNGTTFTLDTTYTFDLTNADEARQFANLSPLDLREVVLHGQTVSTSLSDAIDAAAMGTAPGGVPLGNGTSFRVTAPVAAAEIVAVSGSVRLANATISNNASTGDGGGIFNESANALTITNTTISGNSSASTAPGTGGGGIFNEGTLHVHGGSLTGNTATQGLGNGGAILNDADATARVVDAEITGNSAARAGGGIENVGTIELTDVQLDNNSAGINGGGLHTSGSGVVVVSGGTVSGNSADNEGGGLWNSAGGTLSVDGTTIDGNSASIGGGIFNDGSNGTVSVESSTLSANTVSTSGGGIATEGGNVAIESSTISGNVASESGGGIEIRGGTVLLSNATIAANQALLDGGGVRVNAGTLSTTNTLIGTNQASGTGADVAGALQSNGATLIGDGSGATISGSVIRNVSPQLGVLADNGGSTQTHALLEGSPALGVGVSTGLSVDQRGVARPQGGGIDIGAFESELAPVQVDDIIVDNTDDNVVIEGTWRSSTSVQGFLGADYFYDDGQPDTGDTVTFFPEVLVAGDYEVFVRHTANVNRANNALFTVSHANGQSTARVNQESSGGVWVSIGTFTFDTQSQASISIDDSNAEGFVIADAVRLAFDDGIPTPPPTFDEIIIDNSDAGGVTIVGAWKSSTGVDGFVGSDYLYDDGEADTGDEVVYSSSVTAESYEVFVRHTANRNRASNAQFVVEHSGGQSVARINQQVNGGTWISLGTFSFDTVATVRVSDAGADGFVIADAVRLVTSEVIPPPTDETIVDNADGVGVEIVGQWKSSQGVSGFFGSDYLYDDGVAGNGDAVNFSAALATAGEYEVFARWTANPNRATNAQYLISHSGGQSAIRVNQQVNGGSWNSLGMFSFGSTASITVNDDASDGFVIADSIRLVAQANGEGEGEGDHQQAVDAVFSELGEST